MEFEEDIILIAGPTASGKTGLAIEIANANNALIINADSMQVYADLRVLTARPSAEEETAAPHLLFGHVRGDEPYSAAKWVADVAAVLKNPEVVDRKTVFVGGTGLYFNTLLDGLSPVPQIGSAVREKWRETAKTSAVEVLYDALVSLDPRMADQLRPSDTQRIIRALEVIESTGQSLAQWQALKGEPLISNDNSARKLLLMPDRKLLHERINTRFELMVEQGGLSEVKTLLEKKLPAEASIMKAIGVPQLASHLRGDISLDEAIEKAKAATRQYAKRQSTWFRNSFGEGWEIITQ